MHQSRMCSLVILQKISFVLKKFHYILLFLGILFHETQNYFYFRLELRFQLCGFACIFNINRKLNFAKMSATTLLHSHHNGNNNINNIKSNSVENT